MKLSQQSSLNSFSSFISNSTGLKRTSSDSEDTIPAPKKNKIDILTAELVLALDRTKTSNRNAMYIISAVIKSLGLDIDKYNLSYSTIRNARISKREEIVDMIKEKDNFDDSLVVHWDGKVLPAGNGQPKAERLSIHVTGINTDKNLKTPILSDSTGESQASAIFETLTEWDLCDNVKAMCFDTTSSNTGKLMLWLIEFLSWYLFFDLRKSFQIRIRLNALIIFTNLELKNKLSQKFE